MFTFFQAHFNNILIAFKTDRNSLPGRLELQKRHRDNAEANMETELQNLKSNLQKILSLTSGSGGNSSGGGGGDGTKMMELVYSIQSHVDVVQQSASRISSAAEVSFHVQYNKCE